MGRYRDLAGVGVGGACVHALVHAGNDGAGEGREGGDEWVFGEMKLRKCSKEIAVMRMID